MVVVCIIRKSLGVNYGLGGKNSNGISCTNSLDLVEGRSQKSRSRGLFKEKSCMIINLNLSYLNILKLIEEKKVKSPLKKS